MNNMNKTWAALVLAATLAVASPAMAGDIKLVTSPYASGNGGEFTWQILNGSLLDVSDYHASTKGVGGLETFQSFCIEKNETINYGVTYDVALSPNAGPDTDPISRGTAALYGAFASGLLFDYGYDDTSATARKASAGKLQNAIWSLEGEQDIDFTNQFILLLLDYNNIGYWLVNAEATWGVQAVNLTRTTNGVTKYHQDQLIYNSATRRFNEPVPDGGTTVVLMGFALLGIAVLSRRFGLGAAR